MRHKQPLQTYTSDGEWPVYDPSKSILSGPPRRSFAAPQSNPKPQSSWTYNHTEKLKAIYAEGKSKNELLGSVEESRGTELPCSRKGIFQPVESPPSDSGLARYFRLGNDTAAKTSRTSDIHSKDPPSIAGKVEGDTPLVTKKKTHTGKWPVRPVKALDPSDVFFDVNHTDLHKT